MGTELKNKIAQELNFEFEDGHNQSSGSYRIVRALEEFARKRDETDINLYLNAGRAIAKAMPQAISIDNFLHTHADDERIVLLGSWVL